MRKCFDFFDYLNFTSILIASTSTKILLGLSLYLNGERSSGDVLAAEFYVQVVLAGIVQYVEDIKVSVLLDDVNVHVTVKGEIKPFLAPTLLFLSLLFSPSRVRSNLARDRSISRLRRINRDVISGA